MEIINVVNLLFTGIMCVVKNSSIFIYFYQQVKSKKKSFYKKGTKGRILDNLFWTKNVSSFVSIRAAATDRQVVDVAQTICPEFQALPFRDR